MTDDCVPQEDACVCTERASPPILPHPGRVCACLRGGAYLLQAPSRTTLVGMKAGASWGVEPKPAPAATAGRGGETKRQQATHMAGG